MLKLTKLVSNISRIESGHLFFCRFMQYLLALLQICHPLFDEFCIQRLHIGKNCKLANGRCVSHIKALSFQIRMLLLPLFGCTSKYYQIQSVCLGCVYPSLFEFAERVFAKYMILYSICLKHIIRLGKDSPHIPFFQALVCKKIVKVLVFLDEIQFESRINPRTEFKSYVFMCVCAAISASLSYKSDCISLFNPLLGRQSKSVKPGLIEYFIIGSGVKIRIIQCLPNPQKFNCILIPEPLLHKGCTILYALYHISKAYIIFAINPSHVDCLV